MCNHKAHATNLSIQLHAVTKKGPCNAHVLNHSSLTLPATILNHDKGRPGVLRTAPNSQQTKDHFLGQMLKLSGFGPSHRFSLENSNKVKMQPSMRGWKLQHAVQWFGEVPHASSCKRSTSYADASFPKQTSSVALSGQFIEGRGKHDLFIFRFFGPSGCDVRTKAL